MRTDPTKTSSAVVIVQELAHKVPQKAMSEFEKASSAERKGQYVIAIEHLVKAVALDPAFSAALNDLGGSYLYANQVELAIEQFNKAIAIDPHAPRPYTNLALAFLMQENYREAEHAARQAADLDRGGVRGRLMLGLSLVMQHKHTAEAEQGLRKAAVDYPQAALLLARVLAVKGEIEGARNQLRQYLASEDNSNAELAKEWMERLDRILQPKQ